MNEQQSLNDAQCEGSLARSRIDHADQLFKEEEVATDGNARVERIAEWKDSLGFRHVEQRREAHGNGRGIARCLVSDDGT